MGEALAVVTALTWAASAVLSAEALRKVDPIRANVVKTLFSALAMLPVAVISGGLSNLSGVKIEALFLVILAAIFGYGLGDTFLYQSIVLIGVSRAYTLAYTSPLFTMAIAVLFLGEPFLFNYLVGTVLIVTSAVIVFRNTDRGHAEIRARGVATACIAALVVAAGTVTVAVGLRDIDVLSANALRYPALFLFLLPLSRPKRKWDISKRSLFFLAMSGIVGMVLGGVAFLYSIHLIGASRAASLSASSPVWACIMSSLLLKEKVTPRLLLASLGVVVGTYFLI